MTLDDPVVKARHKVMMGDRERQREKETVPPVRSNKKEKKILREKGA